MSNGSYVECAFPLDTHAPKEPKLRVFVFAFAGGQSWSLRSISAQLDASTTQVIEMEYVTVSLLLLLLLVLLLLLWAALLLRPPTALLPRLLPLLLSYYYYATTTK